MTPENCSPHLILITGIMASGKSTVAQALAERMPRSVHLRGDIFRRMVVNGRAEISLPLSSEEHEQLRLRYRIAASVAKQYIAAGFSVVYQDIIIGPDLAEVAGYYSCHRLHIVVLCPSPAVVMAREAEREKTGYSTDTVESFDAILRTQTPRLGLWLDNSTLTIPETVDNILTNLADAEV